MVPPGYFKSEFVINNLAVDQREYLLKKDVRNEISKFAEVDIAVRGRYVKPKEDGSLICENDMPPLHLLISARTKHNLTLAMKKIQELLCASTWNKPRDDDEKPIFPEEKITVGINVWPLAFSMKTKILGENHENINYIKKETNATISLRGKGLDKDTDEPLHVLVQYGDPTVKHKARQLVLNLIETVQKEFLERFGNYYQVPTKPEVISVRHVQRLRRSLSPKNDQSYPNTFIQNRPSHRGPSSLKKTPTKRIVPLMSISPPRRTSPLRRTSPSKRTPPLRRTSREKRTPPQRRTPPQKRTSPLTRISPLRRKSLSRKTPGQRRASLPRKILSPRTSPVRRSSPTKTISPLRTSPPRTPPGRAPLRRTSPLRRTPPLRRTSPHRRTSSPRRISSPRKSSPPRRTSPPSGISSPKRDLSLRGISPLRRDSPPNRTSPPRKDSSLRRISTPRRNSPPRRTSSPMRDSPPRRISPPRGTSPSRRTFVLKRVSPSRKSPPPKAPPPPKVEEPCNFPDKKDIDKITLGLDSVPATFNLKSKIYGPALMHVKHIEKTTSALLLLQGRGCGGSNRLESDVPPYLLVKYQKPEARDEARKLIFNLIETVQKEFIALYGTHAMWTKKPEIVPFDASLIEKRPIPPKTAPSPVGPAFSNPVTIPVIPAPPMFPSPVPPIVPITPVTAVDPPDVPTITARPMLYTSSISGPNPMIQGNVEKAIVRAPYNKAPMNQVPSYPKPPPENNASFRDAKPTSYSKPSPETNPLSVASDAAVIAPPPPMISKPLPPVIPKPASFVFDDGPRSVISSNVNRVNAIHSRSSITRESTSSTASLNNPTLNQSAPNSVSLGIRSVTSIGAQFATSPAVSVPASKPHVMAQPVPTVASSQARNLQYPKKRSLSPESPIGNVYPDSKKICNPPYLSPSNANVVNSISVQQEQSTRKQSQVTTRCLVPITTDKNPIQSTASTTAAVMKTTSVNGKKPEIKIQWKMKPTIEKGPEPLENGPHEYYISDTDDNKSVICIDSEEECDDQSNMMKSEICDMGVQTDDIIITKEKKINCICGKFTHFVTGIRSVGVQTEVYGKFLEK